MSTITTEFIESAINKVQAIVDETQNEHDQEYFRFHRKRFLRMATELTKKVSPGSLILDIGSHYLHSTLLLTFLGYKVHSMDVGEFTELPLIKKRVLDFELTSIIENDLTTLSSKSACSDEYDVILFTEIFEHITFNPIDFWKHIHRLLKDRGIIYITTPNSLTVYNIFRTLKNLFILRGIGINVNSIFGNVTYGHHWKEYSAKEIKQYFSYLSDGFGVDISTYYYKIIQPENLRGRLRNIFFNIGNSIPYFRDELEVIITIDKSKEWKAVSPTY